MPVLLFTGILQRKTRSYHADAECAERWASRGQQPRLPGVHDLPVGAPSFRDGLRAAVEVFHSLKSQLQLQGFSTAVGDEGGFAPSLESNVQAVDFILEAISGAGYKPG